MFGVMSQDFFEYDLTPDDLFFVLVRRISSLVVLLHLHILLGIYSLSLL